MNSTAIIDKINHDLKFYAEAELGFDTPGNPWRLDVFENENKLAGDRVTVLIAMDVKLEEMEDVCYLKNFSLLERSISRNANLAAKWNKAREVFGSLVK